MQVNGEAIRVIRVGKGVSLRSLAAAVKYSPSALSRIERGERGQRYLADADLLNRIASELGVTVSALVRSDVAA